VSAGWNHTVGIKSDGTLWAWGYNNRGQLGLGDTLVKKTPTQVGSSTWNAVSAGQFHTVGIKSDGTLWAWGYNTNGQLGLGNLTQKKSPVQVQTATNWDSVSAGSNHSVAINSGGTLYAWGRNFRGQLGLNDTTNRTSPVPLQTVLTHADHMQAVLTHVAHSGSAFTTGETITQATTGATGVVQVSGVDATTVSDSATGTWGTSNDVTGGTSNVTLSASDLTAVTVGPTWRSVSAGHEHTLAIGSDGTLWAWGYNGFGNLGLNDLANRKVPVQVQTANTWSLTAAGWHHGMAIKNDGTLWAWGYGSYGQLGVGNTIKKNWTPQPVASGTNWSMIGHSSYHSLAIKIDGTLATWGRNSDGQLGHGNQNTPVVIPVDVTF
jgi:alpha-tubulin suppressor-like RCC1 family protein